MATIKIRSKFDGTIATVRALISHPMELPKKDKTTGQETPAHFIQEMVAELNGKPFLTGNWGAGVSKDPLVEFKVKAAAGDKLKLSWKDNKGETDSAEATVEAKG